MTLKVKVQNKKHSLIFQIEELKKNDIGKEVQLCISRFINFYGNFNSIDIDVITDKE